MRRDLQDYGLLLIIMGLMLIGMYKCTQHVDKIAAKYNITPATKAKK